MKVGDLDFCVLSLPLIIKERKNWDKENLSMTYLVVSQGNMALLCCFLWITLNNDNNGLSSKLLWENKGKNILFFVLVKKIQLVQWFVWLHLPSSFLPEIFSTFFFLFTKRSYDTGVKNCWSVKIIVWDIT